MKKTHAAYYYTVYNCPCISWTALVLFRELDKLVLSAPVELVFNTTIGDSCTLLPRLPLADRRPLK